MGDPGWPGLADRKASLDLARRMYEAVNNDEAKIIPTEVEAFNMAHLALWQAGMLEAARRTCTAALKHVTHLKQWPITPGCAPTLIELVAAVEALQKQGEADHG